jgi:hypothetical protein
MDDSIRVSFRMTRDEMARALSARRIRSGPDNKLTRFGVGLILVVGGIGLAASLADPEFRRRSPDAIGPILAILALLVLFGLRRLYLPAIRRALWKRSLKDLSEGEITWIITDEKLARSAPLAEAFRRWEQMEKVERVPGGFLLYERPRDVENLVLHWLPEHGFDCPEGPGRFESLARSKVDNFVGMRD